jgi:hypothetical protein
MTSSGLPVDELPAIHHVPRYGHNPLADEQLAIYHTSLTGRHKQPNLQTSE